MFAADELSDYVLMKNRRQVVPSLIELTGRTPTTGNRTLWAVWRKMIQEHLNASLQNGTQLEFDEFLNGINALIQGGFATQDELAARLERALRQD